MRKPRTLLILIAVGAGILLVSTQLEFPASAQNGSVFSHPQADQFDSVEFREPRTCGMCHPDQFEQFSGSMHSFAAKDPFFRRTVALAEQDVPGIGEFCYTCHAPVAVLTGQDPFDLGSLDNAAQSGVFCDFCHSVSGMDHLGNAGFQVTPGDTKYGPFGYEPPVFHFTVKSELHDRAEFCGTCHNVSHPANGLVLESTYTEFIEGPYPELGFKCQSCHMTPGITEFQQNPAPFANASPEREHFWTHHFVGGNAFITEMLGSPLHAEMARERLSRAAQVSISNAFPDPSGESFSFTVIVENIGAGHKIPTGVTEERQIWLEVIVEDATGTELAHFGEQDDKGHIADDTMILQTVFGDSEGKPTHRIWLAEIVLSDRRIAPRDSDSESYSLTLPGDTQVSRITAKLWYRSSHQDFIDVLFADTPERELVPNILMYETEAEF